MKARNAQLQELKYLLPDVAVDKWIPPAFLHRCHCCLKLIIFFNDYFYALAKSIQMLITQAYECGNLIVVFSFSNAVCISSHLSLFLS